MADITGSVLGVNINGIGYDVFQDADLDIDPSRVKSEGLATSGRSIQKVTFQVPEIKSVVLALNSTEVSRLKLVAEGRKDVPLAVKVADGSIWRAPGFITFGSYTTQDGKGTVTFFPRTDWVLFAP